MKNFLSEVKGYIAYITKPEPFNLLATFMRIFVYFSSFVNIFLRHEYFWGILLFFLNFFSTMLTIVGYCLFNFDNKEVYDSSNKKFWKKLKKKELSPTLKDKELTYEDKIAFLESFIETLKLTLIATENELEELKKKSEEESNNANKDN